MTIRVTPFVPDLLPALIRFSEATWSTRPRTERFYRWRYLECPNQIGLLALREEECLATLWAFDRPYQIGQERIQCLEIWDWFCLPQWRKSGLGVRLLQELMNRPAPIINVGGSAESWRLMSRLKWQRSGEVQQFLLPQGGVAPGAYIEERLGIPAPVVRRVFDATVRHWFRPRRRERPRNGDVATVSVIGAELSALYADDTGYGMLPIPDPAFIRWLMAGDLGRYLPLYFTVGGQLRGWSLTRLYDMPNGRAAKILEVFTRRSDEYLYPWMVSETLLALSGFHADSVHAGASLESLQQALLRNRFIRRDPIPVHLWGKEWQNAPSPVCVGNNTSDFPLTPYATLTDAHRDPDARPAPRVC